MPLASATVTYNLADMVGADFDVSDARVWVTTNVDGGAVVDTVGNAVRLGDGMGTLASDGTGSLNVWVPGTGSNPASWQTTVHVAYAPRIDGWRPIQRDFGPFTITGNADLADLVAEQEVPPTYLSEVVDQLRAIVDQAQALILSDLGTTDGQTRALVQNPASQTSLALLGGFASYISLAKNPDEIIVGAVTLNGSDQVTSAVVKWPDGSPGTLTITSRHSTGAVLAYNVTYGSPVTKTFTQPAITRNLNGAATNVPAIVVS